MVETILGRLTRGRAALAGAGSGAWFGPSIGLLLALLAAGRNVLVVVASGLGFGAAFGVVLDSLLTAPPAGGAISPPTAPSWPPATTWSPTSRLPTALRICSSS